MDNLSDSDLSKIIDGARENLDSVFKNANEASDLLAQLSDDPRLQNPDFKDILGKIDAAKNACDIVMSQS